MRRRRIPASDSPTVKVTNTPPPDTARPTERKKPKPAKALKVNYSSVSETLVNTAESQVGSKPRKYTRKNGSGVRRGGAVKRITSLENKIKKKSCDRQEATRTYTHKGLKRIDIQSNHE